MNHISNTEWLAQQAPDPEFWEFLSATFREIVQCERQALGVVHWALCDSDARDIDDVSHIAAKFRDLVRLPYTEQLKQVAH